MNTAVQPNQAGEQPTFRAAAHERLVSRALFETPDGQLHQTSVYSTLGADFEPGTPEAEARTALYAEVYARLGYRLIRMEWVRQIGWEL